MFCILADHLLRIYLFLLPKYDRLPYVFWIQDVSEFSFSCEIIEIGQQSHPLDWYEVHIFNIVR